MKACCIFLVAAYGALTAGAASVFAGASSEEDAKALAGSVELKSLSSADLSFLIKERHWLSAAQVLLNRAQETPLDFSAPVRSAVSGVRKELDDLIRALDKKYGEASQVSPAFQWAQNSSHVFLQIKFAQRWNAPGALEVENTSITISDCCFSFKGLGEHSMIKKEYKLFLQFLDPVSEAQSSWHFAAAGRLAVTVAKARARKWERLLRSENVAPENMGIWRDMQEKWKEELASFEGGKLKKDKKKGSEDEDDEDEAVDTDACETGAFADSKVVELCPKAFVDAKQYKGFSFSVLFYTPDSSSKKSQGLSHVWRALADVVPSHNRKAAIGAVDCSRHRGLCDAHGALKKDLPVLLRYAPSEIAGTLIPGTPYKGEHNMEDLAAWASEEMNKKETTKKRRRKAKKEL